MNEQGAAVTSGAMEPRTPSPEDSLVGMFAINDGDEAMLREFAAALRAEGRLAALDEVEAAVKGLRGTYDGWGNKMADRVLAAISSLRSKEPTGV